MSRRFFVILAGACLFAAASCQCGRNPPDEGDGGADAGGSSDSGAVDSGGSGQDAGGRDAGLEDAGGDDAGGMKDAGGSDGGCPDPLTGTYYVDVNAAAGGNGSKQCPFPNITAGLGAASGMATATVIVEPGTYDAPTAGETFPLEIPAGTTVKGDDTASSTRSSFVIDGTGTVSGGTTVATVHLTGTLGFMTVQDSSMTADALILVNAGTPHLTLTTVSGGTNAVALSAGALTVDVQCEITGATQDGINVSVAPGLNALPKLTVTGSAIHGNGNDGVSITLGSVGTTPEVIIGYGRQVVCSVTKLPNANDIYCNGNFGVESDVSVSAEGNAWHDDPPTVGPTAPADISSQLVDDGCPAPANTSLCL